MRALLCLLTVSFCLRAQILEGTLDPRLVRGPGPRWYIFKLAPAAGSDRDRLPVKLVPGDLVWAGRIRWNGSGSERQAAVVYAADGRRLLAADVNGDGRIDAAEVRQFRRAAPDSGEWDLAWKMPFPGPFSNPPVLFRVLESNRNPAHDQPLHINDWFFAYGTVRIGDRPVRVAFQYRADRGGIDPKKGTLGVDGDGDGVVDFSVTSPEWASADNETVVFRAGASYLSIESVNLAARRFTARLHPASNYIRIEMRPGSQVPDFEFVDFQGRAKRLSDIHGKLLALDFWGSWCGPCLAQMPKLKEIYMRWREHGFEILGMNKDDEPASAEAVVARFQLPWTQARTSSILELIERRFRINSWPTLVLLDSERRIIAVELRPDTLEGQLAARLSR